MLSYTHKILLGVTLPVALAVFVSLALCQLAGAGAADLPASGSFRLGQLCSDAAATVCERAWLFEGVIGSDFNEKFGEAIEGHSRLAPQDARRARWLCFNSRGGSSEQARDSASRLSDLGMQTCTVPVQRADSSLQAAKCVSACSILWLAGTRRLLTGDSLIGVHRGYIGDHPECGPVNCAAALMWAFVGALEPLWMGERVMRWEILRQSLAYGPNEAFWITPAEAVRRGMQAPPAADSTWHWRAAPTL